MFVSHSPELVQRVCNRILVINNGGVAFDGSVAEGVDFFKAVGPRSSIG
jgi:ABC-type polysaccharide/polyol phosphate transport system ATPase subunit